MRFEKTVIVSIFAKTTLNRMNRKSILLAIVWGIVGLLSVSCQEEEPIKVTGITVNPTSLYLDVGETGSLTATVSPKDAENQTVIWFVADGNVASVSNGIVTALKVGTTTITAKSDDGGFTASCSVFVNACEVVDLGLSVKWASCNLGATRPEEYGDYFAWGEIQPKSEYSPSNYKWSDGINSYTGHVSSLTKYNSDSTYGTVDNKTCLDLSDDAASVYWGGSWRLPLYLEWDELMAKCSWEWTMINGVNGYKVTGRNGNSIFLPAAGYRSYTNLGREGSEGYFWSSVSFTSDIHAFAFNFSSDRVWTIGDIRSWGFPIRPVWGDFVAVSSISISTTSYGMKVGETQSLSASVSPDNSSYPSIHWSSDDNDVVFVSSYAYGKSAAIIAKSPGTAMVTASSSNGLSASCTVTVIEYSSGAPEPVDLGLSVKWSPCNLGGAGNPMDFGCYYAWGETRTKSDYTWESYQWSNGSSSNLSKYNTDSSFGTVDNKTCLDMLDDVAHLKWGGSWRIPTDAEWEELLNLCSWEQTSMSGIDGQKVTGPNGNSIFVPTAGAYWGTVFDSPYGRYWSSSINTDNPSDAWFVWFRSGTVRRSSGNRYHGYSIRPVSE